MAEKNNSNVKITHFFSSRKKTSNPSQLEDRESFLSRRLNESLRATNNINSNINSNDSGELQTPHDCQNCASKDEKIEYLKHRVQELEEEIKKNKRDYLATKKFYEKATQSLHVEQLKNEDLKKVMHNQHDNQNNIPFSNYSEHFTSSELKDLASINVGSRSDSTFILHCVNFLYKDNIGVLKDRNATVSKATGRKKQITPSKKNLISRVFAERLETENLAPKVFVSRFEHCNILLNNAISNINRRKK